MSPERFAYFLEDEEPDPEIWERAFQMWVERMNRAHGERDRTRRDFDSISELMQITYYQMAKQWT